MLECQSCLRACFRAVAGTHPQTPRSGLLKRQSSTVSKPASSKSPRERAVDKIERAAQQKQKSDSRLALKNSTQPLTPRDVTIKDAATAEALKFELRFLQDPLKLADHVKYTLGAGQEDKALALVQLSSRRIANIVSWNHVMDHFLKNGKTAKALTTFNDMKKRGLQPDGHTYTILLRGLAKNATQPLALGRALGLYHAIHAPKSQVAPTIIHTNCVLTVCSRAGDLDSMWDIVGRLPDKGPHAANGRTYAILLNTIRYNKLMKVSEGAEDEADRARLLEEAIIEGRRLWLNIVQRWRAADLAIEDQLVASMGRLLLIGQRPRDWDDVLSLIQQTMGISRLVPRLGSVARHEQAPFIRKAVGAWQTHKEDQRVMPDDPENLGRQAVEFAESSHEKVEDAFALVKPAPVPGNRRKAGGGMFAEPSNNILSIVVEACHKMMLKDVGNEYWRLLTDASVYGVVPDEDNFATRLRLLRQTRSSAETLTIVQDDMPAAGVKPSPKIFRIAISTCWRDMLNPNAWNTATRLVDLMLASKSTPNIGVLEIYSEMTRKKFLDEIKQYELEQKTSTSWYKLVRKQDKAAHKTVEACVMVLTKALVRLEDSCKRCQKHLRFGSADGSKVEHAHERESIYNLLKQTASFYGICLESDILDLKVAARYREDQQQMKTAMERLGVRKSLDADPASSMDWRQPKDLDEE